MGQTTKRPDIALFLDDHRGNYIPRDFAQSIDPNYWFGVSAEALQTLGDPSHDDYWEVWDDVCRNAFGILPIDGAAHSVSVWATLMAAHDAESANNNIERDRLLQSVSESCVRWNLYQDGALWVVPEGMEMNDSGEWYWPDSVGEDHPS